MNRKHIVLPMSRFLSSYAPAPEQHVRRSPRLLEKVTTALRRTPTTYKLLVDTLNTANVCPGHKFAVNGQRGDPAYHYRSVVDIGLYPSRSAPQASRGSDGNIHPPPTYWPSVELCIECKVDPEAQDPFDDRHGDCELLANGYAKGSVLAQIDAYAECAFRCQQRTHFFMVLILGDFCRLIRFDRSGAIFTERFNYKADCEPLLEFLWRYAHWDPATRGHDPSAERITPSSADGKKMRARALKDKDTEKEGDYVRRMFEESLDERWPWWNLRVDDKDGPRNFLVGRPDFCSSTGVAGRGTWGYVAVDAEDIDGPFYYLKDAWRVVSPDYNKEGDVLRSLNEKNVDYIPTLECHGDVTVPTEQQTKAHKLWDEMNDGKESSPPRFQRHQHYRMVVKEVAQPMSKFTRSRQLVYALWCCIYGHWVAYKAGVLHCDISSGNVLLYYDPVEQAWCGLLTDWELSQSTKDARPNKLHGNGRRGTWAFMSADALDRPWKPISLQDDLESFWHLLFYFALRYLYNNCLQVENLIDTYFNDGCTFMNSGEITCGMFKKLSLSYGHVRLRRCKIFEVFGAPGEGFSREHPVDYILETIGGWLKARYTPTPTRSPRRFLMREDEDEEPCDENHREALLFDDEDDPPPLPPTRFPSPVEPHEEREARRDREVQREKEALEAVAQNLDTHGAMLELIQFALEKKRWPKKDKAGDQLLEKASKPRPDSPALLPSAAPPTRRGSTQNSEDFSSGRPPQKRTLEQVEEPAVQGRSKRARKSGARTPTRRSLRLSRRKLYG